MLNSVFLILGAGLWATDALFRHPMSGQISALSIVFLEHLFALLITAIWVFVIRRKRIEIDTVPLIGSALIGILGSALATLCFTKSFQFVNPSVAILLQKIQPVVVIFLSWALLGEKLSKTFLVWGCVAIGSAYFLSFPNGLPTDEFQNSDLAGVILALLAACLWGISTVIGKLTLKRMDGNHLALWRFFFGFVSLWILINVFPDSKIEIPLITNDASVMRSVFFMALVPGFLGVSLYYRGLTRMKASVATLLELAFPLTAVFVNWKFLGMKLEKIQILSSLILMTSIIRISRITK
jgi:drug/metabolite transporter (DMT)-like permease